MAIPTRIFNHWVMGSLTFEKDVFAPRHVIGWMLFTSSAGLVNGGAVMACKNFVTHITGNVTNLGMDASDSTLALDYILVVASFIGGAMLAVLVAESCKASPRLAFGLPVLLSFVLLVGIGVAGKSGVFGVFGADRELAQRAFAMLGVLTAAMGMVNASIATATANAIRITHLTGPATDFAGNIVRAALDAGAGTSTELRWALLRFAKLASFALGAGIAARYAARLQFDVFTVAAGIMIVALGFTGAPEMAPGENEVDSDESAPVRESMISHVEERDPSKASGYPLRYEDGLPPMPPPDHGGERDRTNVRE